MRCNSCNKFVSFDTDTEPEVDGLEVSCISQGEPIEKDGVRVVPVQVQVQGSVRMVNNCADCGTEMAEASLEIDQEYTIDIPAETITVDGKIRQLGDDDFEVEDDGASRDDELQRTDRRGKPIRNSRYMKHLYKAIAEFTITGPGETTASETWEDSVQGGEFEDIQ
jgi:hypothetical protein